MFILVESPFCIDFFVRVLCTFPKLIPVFFFLKQFYKLLIYKVIQERIDRTIRIAFAITFILIIPKVKLRTTTQVVIGCILHRPNHFRIIAADHIVESRTVLFARHQLAMVVINDLRFAVSPFPVLHHQIYTGQDTGTNLRIN